MKGLKKVATVLAVGGLAFTTVMVGGVAFAPAAQACEDWGCGFTSVVAKSGSDTYCSPATGLDVRVSWAGEAWGPKSYGPIEFPVGQGDPYRDVRCDYPSKTAADTVGNTFVNDSVAAAETAARTRATNAGLIAGACPTPQYRCEPVTVNLRGSGQFCLATGATGTLTWEGTGTGYYHMTTQGYPQTFPRCPMTREEATTEAQQSAESDLAYHQAEATEGATPGLCTPPGQTYNAAGSAGGSRDYCTVEGTTAVVTYTGTGSATSTVSQQDANYVAQQKADAAAQADLAAKTPAGATLGACGVVTVAPEEPIVVAPVQPATIAAPQPAKVAGGVAATVPEAATIPGAVPAGDGSTAPTVPVSALVLLVLGTAVLAVAVSRLVTRPIR